MAMPTVIKGKHHVGYVRLLKNDHKEPAALIPWQTSLDLDISRDSDNTVTKQGSVAADGGLETELTTEFLNSISQVSDDMKTAILDSETVEIWKVNVNRKNSKGQYFADYMQGQLTENSETNDADDNSTSELTFAINGKPKRGWLTLNKDQQEELDYAFRGLAALTDTDETGQGTAYDVDTDRGAGEPDNGSTNSEVIE